MSDDKNIKILFFGDLVGRPGRFAVRDFLSSRHSVLGTESQNFSEDNDLAIADQVHNDGEENLSFPILRNTFYQL